MKKIITFLVTVMMVMIMITGCSSKEDRLISKIPFPELSDTDMNGEAVTNDIFSGYEATIVNFWNNGCGTCIAEMPELEEMYQQFKDQNVNLIGVGADSGESEEQLATAKKILEEKGVTYRNISPNPDGTFYKDFISELTGYPTTYLVDGEGNIIGAPIIGNVKKQEETLKQRIENIKQME